MIPARESILTLREHQSARISTSWDPGARTLPRRAALELDAFQRGTRREVLSVGLHSIKASQFVGTLSLSGGAIDVLPKTDQDEPATRRRLLEMLQVSGLVPTVDVGIAGQNSPPATLLDALLSTYVQALTREWRRGRTVGYVRRTRNRTALKGKLLIEEQIRRNLFHPERLVTRADELLADVPLARLLKAGLRTCADTAANLDICRKARELLPEFEGVSNEPPQSSDERLPIDRRTERFRSLAQLARLLIAGRAPDRPGRHRTFSLMFDMNVVFERFVGRVLRRLVCPPLYRADLQHDHHALFKRNNVRQFRLRPDIAIFERKSPVVVIDTKWKSLDPAKPYAAVAQTDAYQAYAYGREYGSPVVVLLYPRPAGLSPDMGTYEPWGDGGARLAVRTVDIGAPLRGIDGSVAAQLGEMLAALSKNFLEENRAP